MNRVAVLEKSDRKNKKWKVTLPDNKTVNFGAKGYQDFTQHHDAQRRQAYIRRHAKDPKTLDTAGFWARELLWSKPSLPAAVKHVEQKTGLTIKIKR